MPFIWKGTLYQFGGFAIMPFALLTLSGYGEAYDAPRWIGLSSAALAFLLVGAGLHMVQTVGLALATDLVKQEDQPKVVGLMYVMLLLGMLVSAMIYGALLSNYTPGRLIQVIQGSAVVTVALTLFALWKQEARDREVARQMAAAPQLHFMQAWRSRVREPGTMRLLAIIGLGTFGFGMADVLLEPYGGQVLALSVGQTTRLTALLACGTLIGFGIASRTLSRGGTFRARHPDGCQSQCAKGPDRTFTWHVGRSAGDLRRYWCRPCGHCAGHFGCSPEPGGTSRQHAL